MLFLVLFPLCLVEHVCLVRSLRVLDSNEGESNEKQQKVFLGKAEGASELSPRVCPSKAYDERPQVDRHTLKRKGRE